MTGMEPLTSDPFAVLASLSADEISLAVLIAVLSVALMVIVRDCATMLLWLLGRRG